VFDYEYNEIAAMLEKSEAAVRQAVHRAAERVSRDRPRFAVPPETHRRLLEKFMRAAQTGQRAAIRALLADNAQAIGDGGGKVTSVLAGLRGAERVTNLFWAHHLKLGDRLVYRIATINGEPGLLRYVDGERSRFRVRQDPGRLVLRRRPRPGPAAQGAGRPAHFPDQLAA
jgi:RNA polymerase sigma-70 factor, ECF subfamily